jgi:hypothetical protein
VLIWAIGDWSPVRYVFRQVDKREEKVTMLVKNFLLICIVS